MTNPSYTDEQVPEVVRTAPERIFLQVSDQEWDADKPFPVDCDGVSWWKESVLDVEVQYVRADLFAASEADRRRLQAEVEAYQSALREFQDARRYSNLHTRQVARDIEQRARAIHNETKEAKS